MNHGPPTVHAIATAAAIVVAGAVGLAVVTLIRFRMAQSRRKADNLYLATASWPTVSPDPSLPEMTPQDLEHLRFALDRALQPVDSFDGFEHLDPFQTAALRYQVNFLAYGIAMHQARFTPAFGGYMREAQIRLLDKMAQPRVWSYWALENFWGNLSLDGDPVGRENIMYTGFVALQMAMLRVTTGDNVFTQPERFRLDKRRALNESDFVAQLVSEQKRSAYGLIACEPNWIYPLCNTIGMSAVKTSAPDAWRDIAPKITNSLDSEFLDAFGRFVPCRSARTGLALPAVGGAMPLAMPCFFLNAIAPDIAARQWLLLRRRLFDSRDRFRPAAFWPIDTGNYGFSRASAYTAVAVAAAELGDREVYDACMAALDQECPVHSREGVRHRDRASVWSHGVELMARATVANSFRTLTEAQIAQGPRLEGLPYPKVLVASAHAAEGGLIAVVHGGGVYPTTITGLIPHHVYRCQAATATAGADGCLRFDLALTGRTVLRVRA
ncbi:linalool dehydratase/isomerase domain-containing protein [Asticcacaulis sp. AC460]|uniref:linalool dehydratase/isomerase domain-containing protein n=1 Tax=Asticcacaulis sp. AC460 TaxID=1282360 RepID=UPI000419D69A|nr:hypothetical protein [Asticcacaulis sp. AC460]